MDRAMEKRSSRFPITLRSLWYILKTGSYRFMPSCLCSSEALNPFLVAVMKVMANNQVRSEGYCFPLSFRF